MPAELDSVEDRVVDALDEADDEPAADDDITVPEIDAFELAVALAPLAVDDELPTQLLSLPA